MESTSEFDVTKGGSVHLPYSANSLKFAASRSVEIAAMTESIFRPSKIKLIFQNLPVHMRRRVMSHNAKRLPKKLREGHLEQLKKSGLAPKQKRPIRKFRRRPANLLEEYNRRKKSKIWLETHIWHAKRFHMIEIWGHKLAYAPCDKAFRACYRASSAHCLIQDISYYTPIQITGPEQLIKKMFSSITDCSCGLGICAKAYIDGKREGSIHMFERNSYPFRYVGKVQFIWHENGLNKVLWLFVHPSQAKQVKTILKDLIVCNETTKEREGTPRKRMKVNNFSENIQVKLFPGSFNRFRLTGPKSHAVLMKSFKCIEDIKQIKENKWVTAVDQEKLYLEEKQQYWNEIKKASSPAQLPPRTIVGLIIRDPRLSRPNYRTKAIREKHENINVDILLTTPECVSTSQLWNTSLHTTIKKGSLNNAQYIKHISKTQLVPGEVNINDPALQSIPIVLIQHPGSQDENVKKIGYGSGWDIITPPGYGTQFWQTFIMFGARAGGLREAENIAFESGQCYLPPDSNAGAEQDKRNAIQLKEKYFRLPPSKRINFIKLGIVTPFECPWKILLKDWSSSYNNEDIFVMRNKKVLTNLQDSVNEKTELPKIDNASSCLVAIYLKMVKKGNLKRNALISLPEKNDLEEIKSLYEPQHEDPNEKRRKQKRVLHKKNQRKSKRQRAKLKKSGRLMDTSSKTKKKHEPSEYVKYMRELWVPSSVSTVRHSCSRQILGFLPQASFSFSESRSCGIGYIAYNALDTLLKKNLNQVLVRNTSSRKYRLANINIIVH